MGKTAAGGIGKEVIQQLKEGDHIAFALIYKALYPRISGFALRLLHDEDGAAEIVQEVFLKLWSVRHSLNVQIPVESLLYTMAKHIIFNQHKKRRYETAYRNFALEMARVQYGDAESAIIYRDYEDAASIVIAGLPEQRRRVFLMSRQDGLSHKEIAAMLGLSVRTVEGHIRLALEQIRKGLSVLEL